MPLSEEQLKKFREHRKFGCHAVATLEEVEKLNTECLELKAALEKRHEQRVFIPGFTE